MKIIRGVCALCNSRCKRRHHFPRHVALACRRKTAYVELTDAVAMAGSVSRSYGRESHVYLCPLGDHWHLTSTDRFARRAG